jgi:hypothetical protein
MEAKNAIYARITILTNLRLLEFGGNPKLCRNGNLRLQEVRYNMKPGVPPGSPEQE